MDYTAAIQEITKAGVVSELKLPAYAATDGWTVELAAMPGLRILRRYSFAGDALGCLLEALQTGKNTSLTEVDVDESDHRSVEVKFWLKLNCLRSILSACARPRVDPLH